MSKNKGISLITLIVTIMVMLILIGIVGVYSFDNINRGYQAISEREFANVRDYVLRQKVRLETGDFVIDTQKYPNIVLTQELLYILNGNLNFTNDEINNIVDVNNADIEDRYKYHYLQSDGKYFEDTDFANENLTVQDVKNDYIVNFHTGTIISLNTNYFRIEGLVKGLDEILTEIA